MATYTPNYNLSKPEPTDEYQDFLDSYGDNMDIIDQNMGGGGGGGHTIVDPTGADMPKENKLQFTGAVNVSDDSANGQTVVDIEGGGNVYGAFIDPTRVVYSSFVFDSSAHTWTATEDCILTDNMFPPDSTTAYFIRIGGKQVFAGYSTVEDPFVYVKKGQVVEYRAKSGSSLKAYGITQGTNGIFAPVIYSDTERVIGVWRDGKPLYQKTIDVGMLPNSTTKTVNYDVANVDAIVKIFGIGIAPTGGCCPIPFSDDYSSAGNILLDANTSNGTIRLISQSDKSPFHGYITIQYTKTTDVAGSGSWTPSGANAVHYSTNEQVIGTWIDGKPLYEKSFNLPSTITINNASWVSTGVSISDIKNVVDGELNRNGEQKFACSFRATSSVIEIQTYFNGAQCNTDSVVTVRYTKTTD